jgi:hypothetical protein
LPLSVFAVIQSASFFAVILSERSESKDPEELTQPQPPEPFSLDTHPLRISTEIFEKSGKFSTPTQRHQSHHDSPPIHHNLTTKTPPKKQPPPKTPSKKRPKNNKNHPIPPPEKYSRKNRFRIEQWTGRANG